MKDFAVDKSKWKKIKLGDIAEDISVRVDNPSESKFDRFVGLEHFVSGDLKIKNWATTDNLVSSTKAFKVGDVLFARRNAYLRRAALVEFDGVCSGDAFVLRENNSKIVPGYLAFVVNSEKLWDYANANAAGTMSKRVKWRDLANFEFYLPPIDQQKKLSELIWAGEHLINNLFYLKEKLNVILKKKMFLEIGLGRDFNNNVDEFSIHNQTQTKKLIKKLPCNWRVASLGELLQNVQGGFAEGIRVAEGIAQLRMNNVSSECSLVLDEYIYVPRRPNMDRYYIKSDDVLFNNTNSEELVGKSVHFNKVETPLVFSNHFTRLRPKLEYLEPKFLFYWLKYHFKIGLFKLRCTKWIGQAAVQSENLLNLEFVLPDLEYQRNLISELSAVELEIEQIDVQIETAKHLQNKLIENILIK